MQARRAEAEPAQCGRIRQGLCWCPGAWLCWW